MKACWSILTEAPAGTLAETSGAQSPISLQADTATSIVIDVPSICTRLSSLQALKNQFEYQDENQPMRRPVVTAS